MSPYDLIPVVPLSNILLWGERGRWGHSKKTFFQFDSNVPGWKRHSDRFNGQVQKHPEIRAPVK